MPTCQCGKTSGAEYMGVDAGLIVCDRCLDGWWSEPWRCFVEGDSVSILKPVSKMEEDILKLPLLFKGYEAQGYAKVADSIGAVYWVHPESLNKNKGNNHAV